MSPSQSCELTILMPCLNEAETLETCIRKAQAYLQTYYAQRAEHRANHARRASGNAEVRQAEAFQRVIPQVVSEL